MLIVPQDQSTENFASKSLSPPFGRPPRAGVAPLFFVSFNSVGLNPGLNWPLPVAASRTVAAKLFISTMFSATLPVPPPPSLEESRGDAEEDGPDAKRWFSMSLAPPGFWYPGTLVASWVIIIPIELNIASQITLATIAPNAAACLKCAEANAAAEPVVTAGTMYACCNACQCKRMDSNVSSAPSAAFVAATTTKIPHGTEMSKCNANNRRSCFNVP